VIGGKWEAGDNRRGNQGLVRGEGRRKGKIRFVLSGAHAPGAILVSVVN